MGSEKFTDENDYDAFLTAHGGASNAFTEEARSLEACVVLLACSLPAACPQT